jgi:hypothetical protein
MNDLLCDGLSLGCSRSGQYETGTYMKYLTSPGLLIAAFLLASPDAPARAADSGLASTERFIVTYVKSWNVEHCPRILTAITLTNNSAISCEVRVDFSAGSNPEMSACSIGMLLGPRSAPRFCSRRGVGGAAQTIGCKLACSPELSSFEGKAFISTNAAGDCANLGVAARVYYFDCDKAVDVPEAISHSTVIVAK